MNPTGSWNGIRWTSTIPRSAYCLSFSAKSAPPASVVGSSGRGPQDRLADARAVGALVRAVAGEHIELGPHGVSVVRPGEEVAGVGVLGHEPQRLLLAGTADHDRRVRAVSGRGEQIVSASW